MAFKMKAGKEGPMRKNFPNDIASPKKFLGKIGKALGGSMGGALGGNALGTIGGMIGGPVGALAGQFIGRKRKKQRGIDEHGGTM